MDAYRDTTTSFGAAMWAPNAVEIFSSRWQGWCFLILFGAMHLARALDFATGLWIWGGSLTRGDTGEFGFVLWTNAAGSLPFSAGQLCFACRLMHNGAVGLPCRARDILRDWLAFNIVTAVTGAAADIAQVACGLHKPGYEGGEALTQGALAITYALYYVTLRCREEYFFPVLFLTAVASACALCVLSANRFWSILLAVFSIFFALICGTRFLAVRAARKKQERFATVCAGFEAGLPQTNEGQRSMEALRRFTQEVETELEAQFVAARAAVPRWRRLVQTRVKGFERFTLGQARVPGKLRQRTGDLDQLLEEAQMLDDPMHELWARLVGPLQSDGQPRVVRAPVKKRERAMQKCVRCYARDPRCLTDLVRCSVVAQDFSQMTAVLGMFRRISCLGVCTHRARKGRGGTDAGGEGDEKQGRPLFRITQCKNRFCPESVHYTATGLRAIVLNFEVGWKEVEGKAVIVPVWQWAAGETRQQIVEVQVSAGRDSVPLYTAIARVSLGCVLGVMAVVAS
jgi:hypothetical protein